MAHVRVDIFLEHDAIVIRAPALMTTYNLEDYRDVVSVLVNKEKNPETRSAHVLIDMSEVMNMDLQGVALMRKLEEYMAMKAELDPKNGKLILFGFMPDGRVVRKMKQWQIYNRFKIFPDFKSAIESLKK